MLLPPVLPALPQRACSCPIHHNLTAQGMFRHPKKHFVPQNKVSF
ncbi:hypothetical protein RBY4I_3470 [Rhodobacterales bacterium Y4I]|nr:hypothetical protein RBY4I_3470 [Rhodobacterales bacterium Y4I]